MLKQTIQKLHLWLLKRLFCKLIPTKSSIRPHLVNRMHGKITTRKNKTDNVVKFYYLGTTKELR